ncbi:centromere protein C [Euphorbia lathyris]|uniref:centromere protein C n=1 Tax=Euphorbia lathyris TaxID=212925 RepID=UPI0033140F2A
MTDLQDPLEGYSGLSLFPRTFASLPNSSHAQVSDDPHSIHNFLMSLPVQNPDKLIEQAKTILDGTTEVPNVRMISDATSEEKNEVIGDMAVQYPRGQRPGLQRKRARFSLLPSISQPTVNLDATLDFDKDPEEFFLAFERLQNAKKEIAKQTGGTFTGFDHYNVFKVPQSQRPGIPGRSKKAKYKHLYSDIPSQKTCEGDIPFSCGLQQETAQSDVASLQIEPDSVESQQLESTNVVSQQTESTTVATEEQDMTGSSTVKAEKTVNQLIDELLADGYGELEGDRAINLLEERLQIKPLHMEKLNLPEMPDVLKIDFKVSGVNPPKSRHILSDINNLLEGTRNSTPVKLKNVETSVPNFGSPTPPKSPLASLTLLKKHIFQSNPSRDPFADIGIDQSPARNLSPVENINKCSDPVGSQKALCIPDKLKSKTNEDDVPVDDRSSTEVAIEGSTSSFEKHANANLTSLGSGSDIDIRESGSELEGNNVGIGNESLNENSSQADAHVDHHKNEVDDLEDIVEDVMQGAEGSAEPNQNTDYSRMETSKSNQNRLDPATVEDLPVDESAECMNSASFQTQDTSLEQTQATSSTLQTEQMKETCVQSTNELTKGESRPRKERKNKNLSRRQSLAGFGISWEAGVRRSTRIRSRPLEFWRGERFLYGRIHESLATVIGIKYESPGKENGGRTMKVKSFVSKAHKHLVDQAALC